MSDVAVANSEMTDGSEKPGSENEGIKFPPFPDPKDEDFDEDIPEEERNHYKALFKDLNCITSMKLHCSACDRHLGCSARNDNRMRVHPMLRTLVCQTCHTFYNSGEFEKGDDGSELYCRWCGQGGQVYCCSDCPHVFCAKCIKRNLGTTKIKEIEAVDDWKCFKCNNKCLWELRALCWAVIRYCDLKNKITYEVEDPALKEVCQKSCAQDFSECCRNKVKRKEKQEAKKKELNTTKSAANIIRKIPPTIQVKKFASINMEEPTKPEKKAQKRPASPKQKVIKNLVGVPSNLMTQLTLPSVPKKIRMPSSPVINPVRFNNDRKGVPSFAGYSRIRPKPPTMPMMFNGFNSSPAFSDNINLSLESLTQGLDMSAMAALAGPGTSQDDDVVCTPDFPLEPLCEVTEDAGDDDVQCITPGPIAAPKPPLVQAPTPLSRASLPDLNPDNIIQMTDNDVTVNATTGGLKFRVDPQTLSSNKMYRLPDGRIFAINANPNMPGGYSATIVAVTDSGLSKVPSKGTTFAAKLNAVPSNSTPPPLKYGIRSQINRNTRRSTPKSPKSNLSTDITTRVCDLDVPVEWYRFNLVDAIDTLEYSLSRLHQLKKDATTLHLRTRSVSEMRMLHRILNRSLTTSMTRFKEIRDNLNKEYKQYVAKKTAAPSVTNSDDDDDDVEILPEDPNDDPIYIDENSMESTQNDNQEVDLTAAGSSDFNDSSDKSLDKHDHTKDPLASSSVICQKEDNNDCDNSDDIEHCAQDNNDQLEEEKVTQTNSKNDDSIKVAEEAELKKQNENNEEVTQNDDDSIKVEEEAELKKQNENNEEVTQNDFDMENDISANDMNGETDKSGDVHDSDKNDKYDEENILNEKSETKMDAEMSEEMIEDLLKDDNTGDCDNTGGNDKDSATDDVADKDNTATNGNTGKNDTPLGKVGDSVGNSDETKTVHSLDNSDKIQDVLKSEND